MKDRDAWHAAVHGVTELVTTEQLKNNNEALIFKQNCKFSSNTADLPSLFFFPCGSQFPCAKCFALNSFMFFNCLNFFFLLVSEIQIISLMIQLSSVQSLSRV